MKHFMKSPCKHCPFRRDVKPFLHPERAYEIAIAAQNPYNSFPCHKTTEPDEDGEEMLVTQDSKECAGFLTLRAQEGERIPEGFEPAWDLVYTDAFEMYQVYEDEWENR
jgi:hypothetical protein